MCRLIVCLNAGARFHHFFFPLPRLACVWATLLRHRTRGRLSLRWRVAPWQTGDVLIIATVCGCYIYMTDRANISFHFLLCEMHFMFEPAASHVTSVMASNPWKTPAAWEVENRWIKPTKSFLHFLRFTSSFHLLACVCLYNPRWQELVAPESRYVCNTVDQSSLVSGQRRIVQKGEKKTPVTKKNK